MDNFDLRKFLAESKQPIQETVETVNEGQDMRNFQAANDDVAKEFRPVVAPMAKELVGKLAGLMKAGKLPEKTTGDELGLAVGLEVKDAALSLKETADEAMEEIVAEYVQEALGCTDMKEMASIIEARCNRAAMEMKMETIAEVLNAYEGRLAEIKGSQYFKEMADEAKVAAQEGMVKGLHEMAMAVKEEYKKTYMKEEEAVEEKKAPKKEKKEDKEEKEEE